MNTGKAELIAGIRNRRNNFVLYYDEVEFVL